MCLLVKTSIFAKVTLKLYSQDSQTSIIGALKHFENSVDMIRMSSVSPSFCEQVTVTVDVDRYTRPSPRGSSDVDNNIFIKF